jgi:hypothetical protein
MAINYQMTYAELTGGEAGKKAYTDRIEKERLSEQNQSQQKSTYSTGNSDLDNILGELSKVVDNMVSSGKVVNPDIEITPEQITEFTNLASSQISPYYKSQIDWIKEDLDKSVVNLKKQYDLYKQDEEQKFKTNLTGIGETSAEQGFARSGIRKKQEEELIQGTNRSLESNALQLENNLRGLYGTTAKTIGTSEISSLPSYTFESPQVGYQGLTTGRSLNFAPQTNVMGSLYEQKKEAEALRLSKLKQAAREGRSLDFYL